MAQVITYNNLITVLRDIAERSYFLRTFGVGRIADFAASAEPIYPALYVTPESATFFKSEEADSYPVKEITMTLRVIDLVNKGLDNKDDVHSDCYGVLGGIITEIDQHPFYQRSFLTLNGDITLSPLTEWSDDETYGWETQITFRLKNSTDFCGLPFSDVPGYSFIGLESSAFTMSVGYLPLGGGTLTGPLSGTSANFALYLSGGTNLYDIFATNANTQTLVQNGLNTYTGGSASYPTVNISAATLNNLTVSGTSAFGQITSGGTSLQTIIQNIATGSEDITRVQPGSNINTGGTPNLPIVSLVDSPSINNLSFSGTAIGNALSANTVSATTFYSGSTSLSSVIVNAINSSEDTVRVQPGSNINTGGTANLPTINLVSSPSINGLIFSGTANGNALSANTISASTYFSGSTPLSTVLINLVNSSEDVTRVQPGANTYTGGTDNFPSVNIVNSPVFGNLTFSGNGLGNSFSSTTFSAGTINSGTTNLYSIFQTISGDQNDVTRVQPGLNIYTGGTGNLPTVNISAATLSYLSATTISGGTLYSGSTNLYNIFSTVDTNDITRIQPGLNTYTGGTDNLPTINISAATLVSLSATTLSGGTIYSGSTDLSTVIISLVNTSEDVTRVQPGSNINTGGTANLPTVNLTASPSINGLTFSGTALGNLFSANTVSATTFYSGSTNLETIIINLEDTTRVQPGSNITTGGTANLPFINVVASPSFNGITWSGSAVGNLFSANTVSASTFFSGSTPLSTIITSLAGGGGSLIANGLNTYTAGTSSLASVNISAATLNNLSVSGNSILTVTTATTISILNSGATSSISKDYSNNTMHVGVALSNIIGGTGSTINPNLSNVQLLGGYNISATTNNTTYASNIVVTGTSNGNLYATKLFSGSTELSTLFGAGVSALNYIGVSGSSVVYLSATPIDLSFAISDEVSLLIPATAAYPSLTFYAPYTFQILDVCASLNQSGSTGTTIDVLLSGATIFSTKVTVDTNLFTSKQSSAQPVLSTTTIAQNSKVNINILSGGTGARGAKVYISAKRIL